MSKTTTITINGEQIEVKPLDLEGLLEFLVLIAPYISMYGQYQQEFRAVLLSKTSTPLSSLFYINRHELRAIPGELMMLLEKLSGCPIDKLKLASPAEVLDTIIKLDRLNDFATILDVSKTLVAYIELRMQ